MIKTLIDDLHSEKYAARYVEKHADALDHGDSTVRYSASQALSQIAPNLSKLLT